MDLLLGDAEPRIFSQGFDFHAAVMARKNVFFKRGFAAASAMPPYH